MSLRPYQPLADVGLLTAPSLFGCCMLSRDLSGNPKEHNARHPQYHGMICMYIYIYMYSIKIIYIYIYTVYIYIYIYYRLWNGIINISSASTTPYDEKSPRPGKAKKSHMNIMKPTNHPVTESSRFLVLARSKVSGPCGSTEATYLRRPPAARKNLRLLNQGQGLMDQLAWHPVNL